MVHVGLVHMGVLVDRMKHRRKGSKARKKARTSRLAKKGRKEKGK
jgi:hypothetical protein